MIADCGLPIPNGVKKIDLALDFGKPSFLDVFHIKSIFLTPFGIGRPQSAIIISSV
jgi:hypothetical protein